MFRCRSSFFLLLLRLYFFLLHLVYVIWPHIVHHDRIYELSIYFFSIFLFLLQWILCSFVTWWSSNGYSQKIISWGLILLLPFRNFMNIKVLILWILPLKLLLIRISLSSCFWQVTCDIICSFDVQRAALLFFLLLQVCFWSYEIYT